jgi:2'-5' RNA ligase
MSESVNAPVLGGVRAFLALEIEDAFRATLAALQVELAGVANGARFVRTEGIHLTLRFLGDSSPTQLESVGRGVLSLADTCPPDKAPVTGLGVFPPRGAPRVLWLGLGVSASIRELQQGTERLAVACGFPAERRGFEPHLTIARWRDPAPSPRLPTVDLPPLSLHRLVLYRSDLRPTGAVYAPIRTFALGGT